MFNSKFELQQISSTTERETLNEDGILHIYKKTGIERSYSIEKVKFFTSFLAKK